MLTIFVFALPYEKFLNNFLGGYTPVRKNGSLIQSHLITSLSHVLVMQEKYVKWQSPLKKLEKPLFSSLLIP